MKKIINSLYLLPSSIMFLSALGKIFLFQKMANTNVNPSLAKIGDKIIPIAVIEMCCVVLFVVPRTMNIGFFLICSYWGGAIAVDLMLDAPSPQTPIVILILFWIGFYFQRRALFYTSLGI